MKQNKATLVISIDFEYAIGYADKALNDAEIELIYKESEISMRLLKLFELYNTPATWAIVGHLLEKGCSIREGRIHSNFPAEIYTDTDIDWFKYHPKEGNTIDPLWFDSTGLIKLISNSLVSHEIASHSYAHILYGAPNIKSEAVEVDIREAAKIHRENNLTFYSFIFPRNSEGHHDKLKTAGINCFRGESKFWYMKIPGPIKRLARLLYYYLPTARTVQPTIHKSGLINIPDSLLFLGRNGLRRLVLPAVMRWKIKLGLKQAVKKGEIFHLWFHPSNFSHDTKTQLDILDDVLKYASKLRNEGQLEVLTMKEVAIKI